MIMYKGVIDNRGNMHASEVDNIYNDEEAEDIYESVMTGHPVILGVDFDQLEVMADQLGLAFVKYNSVT